MRAFIFFIFKSIWQFSRAVVAIFLTWLGGMFIYNACVFFSLPKQPVAVSSPEVCGKISGVTFEFPRKYVMFWPEYEGKSSWDPGFIHNKKGCDANLRSLMMALSWPDLKSVSLAEATSENLKSKRIILTIRPAEAGRVDVGKRLEYALEGLSYETLDNVEYVESIGLYHVRGADSVLSSFDTGYYWDASGGRVEHVVYCMWLEKEFRYYSCEIEFFVPRYGVFFKVDFTPDKLSNWRGVVESVVGFTESSIKYGVE